MGLNGHEAVSGGVPVLTVVAALSDLAVITLPTVNADRAETAPKRPDRAAVVRLSHNPRRPCRQHDLAPK